jgi:hypothetical protein
MEIHDNGTNITLPDSLLSGKQVIPGTNVTLVAGNWLLGFIAGNVSGQNQAKDVSDPTNGRINTGLITFFNYDVMFDVQNGTVGFYPNSLDGQQPYISSQPQGIVTTVGSYATFNTAANGSPTPFFQWQISTNGGRTWNNLADSSTCTGVTTPSLSIKATAAMNGYAFRVMIAPSVGPIVSVPAFLSVGIPPTFFRQPSGRTVNAGQTILFSAGATGKVPLQYQWQFNGVNLTNTGNVRGATSTVLTLSKVTVANAGTYRLVVTNPYGVATSFNVSLQVR